MKASGYSSEWRLTGERWPLVVGCPGPPGLRVPVGLLGLPGLLG